MRCDCTHGCDGTCLLVAAKSAEGAHSPEGQRVPDGPGAAGQDEPLQKLLEYCDAADDSRYGTLSSTLVRTLVGEALAAAKPEPVSAPTPEPTDAMIEAYLTANDRYWRDTDMYPSPPGRWRTGTVKEATRVSLRAALAVPSDERIDLSAADVRALTVPRGSFVGAEPVSARPAATSEPTFLDAASKALARSKTPEEQDAAISLVALASKLERQFSTLRACCVAALLNPSEWSKDARRLLASEIDAVLQSRPSFPVQPTNADLMAETVVRLHHSLAKHGWHPGRTDEPLADCVEKALSAGPVGPYPNKRGPSFPVQVGAPAWISVEERLPENDDFVLALWADHNEGHSVLRCWWNGDSADKVWYDPDEIGTYPVTHWMPLPAAPSQAEGTRDADSTRAGP